MHLHLETIHGADRLRMQRFLRHAVSELKKIEIKNKTKLHQHAKRSSATISLNIVPDRRMREVCSLSNHYADTADVLSFNDSFTGLCEVYVNWRAMLSTSSTSTSRATSHIVTARTAKSNCVAFLVHGLLHAMLGLDHHTRQDYEQMQAYERALLQRICGRNRTC